MLFRSVTTDGKRLPAMPDVPSMSEAGVPNMVISFWIGLVGPAGMPRPLVERLRGEVVKALAVPSVRDRFVTQGAEPVGGSSEELAATVQKDLKKWAKVARDGGVKPE